MAFGGKKSLDFNKGFQRFFLFYFFYIFGWGMSYLFYIVNFTQAITFYRSNYFYTESPNIL